MNNISQKENKINSLLSQLDGVKKSGDGFMARCPAHDDKNPSLSIKQDNGRIMLHCFAGCEIDAITSSLGITLKDLFPESEYKKMKTKAGTPEIKRMNAIEAEDVEWLWEPFIAKKKITFLEGDPGVGKSWIALAITAAISDGHHLPDPKTGKLDYLIDPPADVIYMSAEDGLADTLKPRLEAAGANHARVAVFSSYTDEHGDRHGFTFQDMQPLSLALLAVNPALIIVDPIQGFLGRDVDAHRANDVRPLLQELGELAETHNCAVLIIRHLTKQKTSRSISRGMGSIDFSAVARSILLVGEDPNNSDDRAVVQIKNSLGPKDLSIGFSIKDGEFHWTGKSELTSNRLFADEDSSDQRTSVEGAREFLLGELSHGPVNSETLLKTAEKMGLSRATIWRAKKEMKIDAFKATGRDGKWQWFIPEKK